MAPAYSANVCPAVALKVSQASCPIAANGRLCGVPGVSVPVTSADNVACMVAVAGVAGVISTLYVPAARLVRLNAVPLVVDAVATLVPAEL